MKDLWIFIKNNKLLFSFLIFAPLAIVVIFGILEYVIRVIDMSAGEWAGLFGTILGYYGAVFLGIVAFWQNERLGMVNEKFNKINAQLQLTQNAPLYSIVKVSGVQYRRYMNENDFVNVYNGNPLEKHSKENAKSIEFTLTNVSEYPIHKTNVRYIDYRRCNVESVKTGLIENILAADVNKKKNVELNNKNLMPNEEVVIKLSYFPEENADINYYSFMFDFINMFNFTTKMMVTIDNQQMQYKLLPIDFKLDDIKNELNRLMRE